MGTHLRVNEKRYSVQKNQLLIAKGDRYDQLILPTRRGWTIRFEMRTAGLALSFRSVDAIWELVNALQKVAGEMEERSKPLPEWSPTPPPF